jgi:hypothetical protein
VRLSGGFLVVGFAAAGVAAVSGQSALSREPARARMAVTSFSGWTVYTVGGTGLQRTDPRDGRAATATRIHPATVTALTDGTIAWTAYGPRVRTITPYGRVGTFAGTRRRGFTGDGGPAIRARLSEPGDLAALPGGGALIVDGERVRAVDAAGIIKTVAGTGKRGFSGDGGPAVRARFRQLGDVAPLPDGGFVVTDIGNERVRQVDADGTITTIAGTGERGSGGDGGPARLAELNIGEPSGLAVAADGAVLVGEWGNHAIRRIAADGIISKVAGTGSQVGPGGPRPAAQTALNGPLDLVALPDGGILVSDGGGLRHIGTDGVLREQRIPGCTNLVADEALPIEGTNIFFGDGRPAGCTEIAGSLARTPDGSIIATDLGRLRMLASPTAATPAVAITNTTMRSRSVAASFATTVAGRAKLRIVRGGRVLAFASKRARPGRNRIRVHRRLAPGVYRLRLRVGNAGGAIAHEWVAALVGRLTAGTARRAATRYMEWIEDPNFGRCQRFSTRRIDCVSHAYGYTCFEVHAIAVESSGLVGFRRYGCRDEDRTPFRRRPRWTFDGLSNRIPYPPFHRPGTGPAPLAG